MNPMRRYLDIVSEAAPPMLFHVTYASRLPSIKKLGLQTGRKRNWNNPFGAKLGETKLIYLFSDFSEAVRWAFHMEWETKKPAVILALTTNALLQRDPRMQVGYSTSLVTSDSIPPENIKRVIPMTPELAKQVARTGKAELPDL